MQWRVNGGGYPDQFPSDLANERDFYGVNKTKASDVYFSKSGSVNLWIKKKN